MHKTINRLNFIMSSQATTACYNIRAIMRRHQVDEVKSITKDQSESPQHLSNVNCFWYLPSFGAVANCRFLRLNCICVWTGHSYIFDYITIMITHNNKNILICPKKTIITTTIQFNYVFDENNKK